MTVPDMGEGCCLGPEGNGVSLGEGPASQEGEKICSQCSERTGTTWAKTRKTGQVGHDEEGSARTECTVFFTRWENQVINVSNYDCRIVFEIMFLFQENESFGIKTIYIDPLSARCCTSRREQ